MPFAAPRADAGEVAGSSAGHGLGAEADCGLCHPAHVSMVSNQRGGEKFVKAAPATHDMNQAALCSALEAFLAQPGAASGDAYVAEKRVLRTSVLEFVRPYMKVSGALASGLRLLDWGCRQAPFSALARAQIGPTLELHGCDVFPEGHCAAYHEACGPSYAQIQHPWKLDYPDHHFDAVLASGTLEHVPNDAQSLTELWRVLKPNGALLITHLPNRYFWTEFVSRSLFPQQAHRRRYDLRETRNILLHHGFEPLEAGYHQFTPSSLPVTWRRRSMVWALEVLQPINILEQISILNRFSATLWILAGRRCGL